MYIAGVIGLIIGTILFTLLTFLILKKAMNKWDALPQQVF
jgi:hypothetical protein